MMFSEEFTYKFVNVKNYFRVPVSSSETIVFVNDNKNSIAKIEEHKLTHSWTLEHPHCFTCPVIFNNEEDSFYCAVDETALLKWSLNDENLAKAFKFQFQEKIFAVLLLQSRPPIVLFSSGKVLPVEMLYISTNPIGKKIFDTDQILWADATVIHSETKIFCLTLSKEEKTYKLHEISIKKNEIFNHSFQIIANGDKFLKCWCFNKFNFSLIAVWSNGAVISYSHQTHQPITLLTLPDFKSDCHLAIATLDADHFALTKSDTHKKGTVIEIWDLKFTSIKAVKYIKVVSTDYLQVETKNSSLFILIEESLTEVPFNLKKSTLATALGKSSDLSSKSEYSWQAGNAVEINPNLTINVENSSKLDLSEGITERMDTDISVNDLELLAQRLINEGSRLYSETHESDLYNILHFALRLKTDKKEKSELEPDVILNAVFSTTFRETAIVPYIRKLSLNETMHCLETLLNFLDNVESQSTSNSPTEMQLFNWLILLMKTHTESLLISKDKTKTLLLKRLDQCISKNIELYENYHQAQNMIHMLQKEEKLLVNKPLLGKYFLETINI